MIEKLEPRLVMSVSGFALANYVKGATLTYNTDSAGTAGTLVTKVRGAVNVKGVKTTVVLREGGNAAGTQSASSNTYYVASTVDGVQELRENASGQAASTKTEEAITFQHPKLATVYPARMVAGHRYSYGYTQVITHITNGGKPSTASYAESYSVKLRSEKLHTVKVAAGTFRCYVVDETTLITINGKQTEVDQTEYLAPGVGLVYRASSSYSLSTPKTKRKDSLELKAYDLPT